MPSLLAPPRAEQPSCGWPFDEWPRPALRGSGRPPAPPEAVALAAEGPDEDWEDYGAHLEALAESHRAQVTSEYCSARQRWLDAHYPALAYRGDPGVARLLVD